MFVPAVKRCTLCDAASACGFASAERLLMVALDFEEGGLRY